MPRFKKQFCHLLIAPLLLCAGSATHAATITDDFSTYADLPALQTVYTVTTNTGDNDAGDPEVSSVTVNTTPDNLTLFATEDTNDFARITNENVLIPFTADQGAEFGVTTVSGSPFSFNGRVRLGLVSATDSTDRTFVQFQINNSTLRVQYVNQVNGVNTTVVDSNGSGEFDNTNVNDRFADWTVRLDGTNLQVARDEDAVEQVFNVSNDIDYSQFAGGAYLFLELNTAGGNADRQVTVDDLFLIETIPEPASMTLLALGCLIIGAGRRRRR